MRLTTTPKRLTRKTFKKAYESQTYTMATLTGDFAERVLAHDVRARGLKATLTKQKWTTSTADGESVRFTNGKPSARKTAVKVKGWGDRTITLTRTTTKKTANPLLEPEYITTLGEVLEGLCNCQKYVAGVKKTVPDQYSVFGDAATKNGAYRRCGNPLCPDCSGQYAETMRRLVADEIKGGTNGALITLCADSLGRGPAEDKHWAVAAVAGTRSKVQTKLSKAIVDAGMADPEDLKFVLGVEVSVSTRFPGSLIHVHVAVVGLKDGASVETRDFQEVVERVWREVGGGTGVVKKDGSLASKVDCRDFPGDAKAAVDYVLKNRVSQFIAKLFNGPLPVNGNGEKYFNCQTLMNNGYPWVRSVPAEFLAYVNDLRWLRLYAEFAAAFKGVHKYTGTLVRGHGAEARATLKRRPKDAPDPADVLENFRVGINPPGGVTVEARLAADAVTRETPTGLAAATAGFLTEMTGDLNYLRVPDKKFTTVIDCRGRRCLVVRDQKAWDALHARWRRRDEGVDAPRPFTDLYQGSDAGGVLVTRLPEFLNGKIITPAGGVTALRVAAELERGHREYEAERARYAERAPHTSEKSPHTSEGSVHALGVSG